MGSGFRLACEVDYGDGDAPLAERLVITLVAATLYEAGAAMDEEIELGGSFVDAARIAELNEEHREVDGPTDVLSFPIDGLVEPIPVGMPRQLGDVVVCADYVRRQLAQGTTMQDDPTLEAALERCIVHGVLHLAGFDHELGEDAAREMFALEQLVLDRVRGVRDPEA
jgi:probable rRNA maturation factor